MSAPGPSASTSASSSSSSSLQYHVVVVGPCGSGKSTLINKLAGSKLADVGESPDIVTCTTKEYVRGQYVFHDTVGLDKKGYEPGLPITKLKGKHVHLIILIASARWRELSRQYLEDLPWSQHVIVSKWAAHGSSWATSPNPLSAYSNDSSPPSVELLKNMDQLKFQLFESPSISAPDRVSVSAYKSKYDSVSQSFAQLSFGTKPSQPRPSPPQSKMWFGTKVVDNLTPTQRRLYDTWKNWKAPMPTQKTMPASFWQSIESYEELAKYRRRGECILEYYFLVINPGEAQDKAQNESLHEIVREQDLEEYIDKLYHRANQTNVMGSEKYADYIEALAEIITTRHTRYIVDFMNKCHAFKEL